MKIGGQISKNVNDVQKVFLKMNFCALLCFIEFYVFVWDTIYVNGFKIKYEHIRIEIVWVKFTKGKPRVVEERPNLIAKTA